MQQVQNSLLNNRVLGLDVGGTKVFARLVKEHDIGFEEPKEKMEFKCADYKSLQEIIEEIGRKSDGKIVAVCGAIAGPVSNGRVKLTNLNWPEISEADLVTQFGFQRAKIVNDMVGQGASLYVLPTDPSSVYHFPQSGDFSEGFISSQPKWSFIAPGTGFGKSDIFFENDGSRVKISDSEGGHIRWGPDSSDGLQKQLLEYLSKQVNFVSQETVLKGSALKTIYDFFLERYPGDGEPQWLTNAFKKEDPNAIITKVAQGQLCEYNAHCKLAYDMYCSILGSVAGDEAMRIKSGVVIGGGVFPKIKAGIEETGFMNAYLRRDLPNMVDIAKRKPLVGILNPEAGAIGAIVLAQLGERFEVVSS